MFVVRVELSAFLYIKCSVFSKSYMLLLTLMAFSKACTVSLQILLPWPNSSVCLGRRGSCDVELSEAFNALAAGMNWLPFSTQALSKCLLF